MRPRQAPPTLSPPSVAGGMRLQRPLSMGGVLLCMLLVGCNRREPNPCPLGCVTDSAAPADRDTAGGDSGETTTFIPLPAHCKPGDGGVDPFVLIGSEKNTEEQGSTWFTEILDLVYLPDAERVITAGQGGVAVFGVDEPEQPVTYGNIGAQKGDFRRYYHVLPIDADTAWATHRDHGLDVLDLSDVNNLVRTARLDGLGFEGLDASGEMLYVVSTEGSMAVFDVADPLQPKAITTVDDLSRPWDVVVVGEVAYVADGDLGVVAYSIATPSAPTRLSTVSSAGHPIRLVSADGYLYVAAGAAGLEIFDLSDPSTPALVHRADVGGGALDVAVHDGWVGVVTQEAVVMLDIGREGTPEQPVPHAYEETEQYAMSIDAAGAYWAVGDWNILGMWQVREQQAPAVDLSLDTVAFLEGAEARLVSLTNRGGADLLLTGATAPQGVSVLTSAQTVPPGDSAVLQIAWDGDGELGEDAALCLASNDPSRPTVSLSLTSGVSGEGKAVGQEAPDFSLRDLDGNIHNLSEQRGHPVVLAYFATW